MDSIKKAQEKYALKRVVKTVSFNSEKELDLIKFSENLDFSNWVKSKIRGDMESEKFKKKSKKEY
ncbi:TPA: hypothetical protein ACFOIC_001809 [Neisseria meningitidis]|uniref:hypothetical protein n=1 Tax=Neisseria meningitidis TaxID=487 RepID=UPI00032FE233|nr:hypothetical protein [Neisseria meningitidis]EOC54642.1 hypothetical protein NM2003051_1021 [Neisseria meningitidis 2003051]